MKGKILRVNRSNYNVLVNREKIYTKSKKLKEVITVGDEVIIRNNQIDKVEPRKSLLLRKSVKQKPQNQALAANMDLIYICMSANKDFNLKKLRDYLTLAKSAKVEVKVLLTKIDLTDDVESFTSRLDIDVTPVSILQPIDHLKKEIFGKTVCFIGASGVGKSSIISLLTDKEIETKEIRESDAQGRHTTTARTMYVMDDYSVIDIPGIRIVNAVDKDYSEIEEAALQCKFSNCKHITEPKCHVKELVETGEIEEEDYLEFIQK